MLNEKTVKTLIAIITPPIIVKSMAHSQRVGPTNLYSTINENTINLTWDNLKSENISAYNIYRAVVTITGSSVDSCLIEFVNINSSDSTNYTDRIENYQSNNMFIYYVTAVFNDGTESSPSNYIKVIKDGLKMEFMKEKVQN